MGTAGTMEAAPLACAPGAIPEAEREGHAARTRALFGWDVERREALPDGYAFRFPAEALGEVARWVTLERRCCPFLTFRIETGPPHDAVWLRITGPEGAREIIEAELILEQEET